MWRPGSRTSAAATIRSPPTVTQPSSSQASVPPRSGRSMPYHASASGGRRSPSSRQPGSSWLSTTRPARRGELRQPRLDRAVGLHAAVAVEMVLGDVRVQRDVDATADRRELELGQLEHDPVVGPQLERPLDQRCPDVPAQDRREAARLEHRRQQRGGRRLALRAGHPGQARAGEAQEEVDLADHLGAARLGGAERLAQPWVGRREAGRHRGAGHQQVGVLDQRRGLGLVDAEGQAHRARAEGRDGIGQLGGGSPVVGRDHRAGIGQEAAGGHAGAGEPEHDRAAAAQVVGGPDRRGGGGHHRSAYSPCTWYVYRKRLTPSSPASAATIQKRSVIFSSAQPMSSKWWWSGVMRKTRRPRRR